MRQIEKKVDRELSLRDLYDIPKWNDDITKKSPLYLEILPAHLGCFKLVLFI